MSSGSPYVVDEASRPVRLGLMIGQGGEGTVYEVSTQSDIVAKVYHKSLSPDRAAKLAAMIKMRNEVLSKLSAWPQGLLSDRSGNAVGLLMERVSGRKDIHHLYSPKSRRNDFQQADWRFLVRAAVNTARAFAAVHDTGCVIGDVNHGGVLVGQDATVKLIDCDSFQVTYAGQRFLCEVGVETFTPPELQSKSFAGVLRTSNHDVFGLAVMTFLLLFMGRHPFAGRYLGQGDMPIAKAIAESRFAYGARHQQLQMKQPPGTPGLAIVGKKVSELFEQAFARESVSGGRPSARDWMEKLGTLERELKQCSSNSAHWYHQSISCPWCPMEGATGVPLFGLAPARGSRALFDLVSFWKQVESIPHPGPAPEIMVERVQPSQEAKSVHRRRLTKLAMPALVAVSFVIVGMNGGGFLMFPLGALAFFLLRAFLDPKKQVAEIVARKSAAQANWSKISKIWEDKAGASTFERQKNELQALRLSFEAAPQRRQDALKRLKTNQRQLQLDAFLDQFEIAQATIPTIGPGRKQTLESYGIETALDVTAQALSSVPGFGPKTLQKLLQWRESIVWKFSYDPSKPIDPKAIQKVESDHLAELKVIEGRLVHGLDELRQASGRIRSVREHMRRQVEEAALELAKAEADFRAL